MVRAEGPGRNRTCTTDSDCNARSGASGKCSREHPENCARCEMHSLKDGTVLGVCACESSTRCAMCTVGGTATHANGSLVQGYFRQNNECVQCPDNPWLLVLAFVVLVVFGGLAGYYLNKKKFNLNLDQSVDYVALARGAAGTKAAVLEPVVVQFAGARASLPPSRRGSSSGMKLSPPRPPLSLKARTSPSRGSSSRARSRSVARPAQTGTSARPPCPRRGGRPTSSGRASTAAGSTAAARGHPKVCRSPRK